MLEQGGIGKHIGDGGRNRSQGRPKQAGQAQEWSMDVEMGESVPLGNQFRDAGTACEELAQRTLALDDDPAAALLNERSVTDEVDRIAQALLGVQQDGPALM